MIEHSDSKKTLFYTSMDKLLNYFNEGDCNTKKLQIDIECLYSLLGENSKPLIDIFQNVYKDIALVSIGQLQKNDPQLGAIAEITWRLMMNDASELKTNVPVDELELVAKKTPKFISMEKDPYFKNMANTRNKGVNALKNSNDDDPTQFGGMLQFRGPPLANNPRNANDPAHPEFQRGIGHHINGVIGKANELFNQIPARQILEACMRCAQQIPVLAKQMITEANREKVKNLFIGIWRLLQFTATMMKVVSTLVIYSESTVEERLIIDVNFELLERAELNQYKATLEFYKNAISMMREADQGGPPTSERQLAMNNMEALIQERTQLHNEYRANTRTSSALRIFLRGAILSTRKIVFWFLFAGLFSTAGILGVEYIVGGIWNIIVHYLGENSALVQNFNDIQYILTEYSNTPAPPMPSPFSSPPAAAATQAASSGVPSGAVVAQSSLYERVYSVIAAVPGAVADYSYYARSYVGRMIATMVSKGMQNIAEGLKSVKSLVSDLVDKINILNYYNSSRNFVITNSFKLFFLLPMDFRVYLWLVLFVWGCVWYVVCTTGYENARLEAIASYEQNRRVTATTRTSAINTRELAAGTGLTEAAVQQRAEQPRSALNSMLYASNFGPLIPFGGTRRNHKRNQKKRKVKRTRKH